MHLGRRTWDSNEGCANCGRPGHIARDCASKGKGTGKGNERYGTHRGANPVQNDGVRQQQWYGDQASAQYPEMMGLITTEAATHKSVDSTEGKKSLGGGATTMLKQM